MNVRLPGQLRGLSLALLSFICLALVGSHGVFSPSPAASQANVPCYRLQGGAKTVAGSGCEYEFQSGSILDVQNGVTFGAVDLTVSDDMVVGDDLNVGGWISTTEQSVIVVTSGGTITPLGSNVPISAAGSVGTSSIANPTAGRILFIHNVANVTITLTDTGTLKLSGNIALGQYDTLTLKGDGTNWLQVSTANN